jgi:hypothetical protein
LSLSISSTKIENSNFAKHLKSSHPDYEIYAVNIGQD